MTKIVLYMQEKLYHHIAQIHIHYSENWCTLKLGSKIKVKNGKEKFVKIHLKIYITYIQVFVSEWEFAPYLFWYFTQVCAFKTFVSGIAYFYAPEIEDRGAYCFCPVCHSVTVILIFWPPLWNFNLLITFEQWVLKLWYSLW